MAIKPGTDSSEKKKVSSQKLRSKKNKKLSIQPINSISETLFPLIGQLHILSDLSLVTDSKGNILKCGKAANHLKCSKKTFVGKNIFLFIHSDISKNVVLKEAAAKRGIALSFKLEYSKNKTVHVLSRWIAFVDRSAGNSYYLILNNIIKNLHHHNDKGVIADARKEIEWVSSKGHKERSTVYSDNLNALTGFSQSEIKKKPEGFHSIIYEEDYPDTTRAFKNFIYDYDNKSLNIIYRIQRKDKKITWVKEVIVLERTKTGKPKKAKGIISDVSDLMQADNTLIKTIEKLRRQNESKDKFISMLSHDLRAPFTSILGFAEILMNEQGLPAEEKLEYLSYIHDSSQNQLRLINYLLDWSRLQTGRIKFDLQRLNVQALVFNCVSSLTGNAIRKNIEIKVKVNNKIYVQIDEGLLVQVITNLLSNAIKFSQENKSIDITADIFNDELIEFVVRDEGVGINSENKLKLFKIEKMLSTEGTKGEKGTGLGLSLAKEIVEKHKGNIWFYSEIGKGSEFHFTIPRSPNIILLVDNNENDKKIYEGLISEYFPAYRVIRTSNGYEAMNLVFDNPPSLIITENDMPLMNGIQLIESIRREEKYFALPIILSARELTDAVRDLYNDLSVFAILQKPVKPERFIEKLNNALDL